jgi:hypothetical protein
LTPELHDVGKIGMTLVAVLDKRNYYVPVQVQSFRLKCCYQVFDPVPEVDQTVSNNVSNIWGLKNN